MLRCRSPQASGFGWLATHASEPNGARLRKRLWRFGNRQMSLPMYCSSHFFNEAEPPRTILLAVVSVVNFESCPTRYGLGWLGWGNRWACRAIIAGIGARFQARALAQVRAACDCARRRKTPALAGVLFSRQISSGGRLLMASRIRLSGKQPSSPTLWIAAAMLSPCSRNSPPAHELVPVHSCDASITP